MKKIITISRQFGAGGGEIGRKVASELGFSYTDKDLIYQIASEISLNPEQVKEIDEKVSFHFGFAQSLFDMYNSPLDEKLFKAQKEVIRKLGERGNCVIVGRNANSILAEYDNSLHVFIHADSYWRVQRMKKDLMKDVTESKIAKHLKDVDKARAKYCLYYTSSEFGAADSYDLCLCSSTLGIDQCVKIICEIAES